MSENEVWIVFRGKLVTDPNMVSSSYGELKDLDNLEEVVEVEVEFICPVKGKVKQKVKMKRLKPVEVSVGAVIASSEDLDNLDADDTSDIPIDDEE